MSQCQWTSGGNESTTGNDGDVPKLKSLVSYAAVTDFTGKSEKIAFTYRGMKSWQAMNADSTSSHLCTGAKRAARRAR